MHDLQDAKTLRCRDWERIGCKNTGGGLIVLEDMLPPLLCQAHSANPRLHLNEPEPQAGRK